jgi:pimeloyl-ACP methyl ester carboxylesterase
MNPKHTITTKHFTSLTYKRYGEGPAILLLHGFPASGSLWGETVFRLAQTNTVLVPDIPGTGESELEGEETTIEELATMVPAILDHAGIDVCTLAGHSMGGYISLAVAEHYPDRLNGLSLVHSTASADDEAKKEKRRKSIALIRKGGKSEFIRGMIPALFSEEFKTKYPEALKERIEEGLKLPEASMIAFYNAMITRPDRLHILQNVPFPMQWILGKNDSLIPWQSCLQQSSVPDVSFVALYGECGHMSMVEQPEKLQNDLLRFSGYCLKRNVEAILV